MSNLYFMVGKSKQALHKYLKSKKTKQIESTFVLDQVNTIRVEHPFLGARKLYKIIMPSTLGRDRFESLLLANGYGVRYKPNFIRTTYRQNHVYYPNKIKGLELTDINQLWVTDITYFLVGSRFYYLTFILDVYSRRIIGYNASDNLRAEANIKALKMAFKLRRGGDLSRLIHHSDKGSQYIDKNYLVLLKNISISMCDNAYENAYAERINGIIKNEYLKGWVIKNKNDLDKKLSKAVNSYNLSRPHLNLPNMLTPVTYEKELVNLSAQNKPKVKIYTEEI